MQEFLTKDKNGKYESAMKSEYQSTFLPIFSHAEAVIKATITKYFWELRPKRELIQVLEKYLKDIEKRVPKELPNRDVYINGLRAKTDKMVKMQYTKALATFTAVLGIVMAQQTKQGERPLPIKSPKQLVTYIQEKKIKYDMWSEAKAVVRVEGYPQQIKQYIDNLTGEVITTQEPGKKPISLWQKAELDVRYAHQYSMVDQAERSGDDLWWISSHPDCSERCEHFQGELVSLSKHAKSPQKRYRDVKHINKKSFECGMVDGHTVYSLKDIMDCQDKYGYNNMIICGFNCRHYLIKYEKGKEPPKEYSKEDVKRMRAVEGRIREYERQIRDAKTKEKLYNEINDKKTAMIYRKKAAQLTEEYKRYCNKNGFAWQEYRINI